jgi:hypothetical protein
MQQNFILYFWTLEQINIYKMKFISQVSDFKPNLYIFLKFAADLNILRK